MTESFVCTRSLRDRHLDLAIKFEAEAFTCDDGFDMEYFQSKCEEALAGASYFESLHIAGITEVRRART
mgnify:CR=1 FL=1